MSVLTIARNIGACRLRVPGERGFFLWGPSHVIRGLCCRDIPSPMIKVFKPIAPTMHAGRENPHLRPLPPEPAECSPCRRICNELSGSKMAGSPNTRHHRYAIHPPNAAFSNGSPFWCDRRDAGGDSSAFPTARGKVRGIGFAAPPKRADSMCCRTGDLRTARSASGRLSKNCGGADASSAGVAQHRERVAKPPTLSASADHDPPSGGTCATACRSKRCPSSRTALLKTAQKTGDAFSPSQLPN